MKKTIILFSLLAMSINCLGKYERFSRKPRLNAAQKELLKAINTKDLPKVKNLINKKMVNIHETFFDKIEDTPLHQAIWVNAPNIIKYLLEVGADINAENNESMTPLVVAMNRRFDNDEKDNFGIIEYLLKKGANPNKGKIPPLSDCITSPPKKLVLAGTVEIEGVRIRRLKDAPPRIRTKNLRKLKKMAIRS